MSRPITTQQMTLARQKRRLYDMVQTMIADLSDGCTKQERIKLYGCINDSEKSIIDIKKIELSRNIDARLKKLGVKKA